jgi:hypothetical protein
MNGVLPGEDLIEAGLRDLHEGRETAEALLVAIGSPRLRGIGLDLPSNLPDDPEFRLYDLLEKYDPDTTHSLYNAFIRKLVSYERAAERAQSNSKNSMLTDA